MPASVGLVYSLGMTSEEFNVKKTLFIENVAGVDERQRVERLTRMALGEMKIRSGVGVMWTIPEGDDAGMNLFLTSNDGHDLEGIKARVEEIKTEMVKWREANQELEDGFVKEAKDMQKHRLVD